MKSEKNWRTIGCYSKEACENYSPDNCMYCTSNYNTPQTKNRFKAKEKRNNEN